MKATVNPRSITEAEEPYLGLTPTQLAAVYEQVARSESREKANGLVGWLALKTVGVDEATQQTKANYRRILRELRPTVPPPGRGEKRMVGQHGGVELLPLVAAGGVGSAFMLTHDPLWAALAGFSIYVTYIMGEAGIPGLLSHCVT